MANLVKPAALLVLIFPLSGSVSNAAPTELILDNHPSFRDETVRDWCVLLINGTVIPNAPELYLWPVRKEAVGWYQCPSTVDNDAVDTIAAASSEKQSQKGLQTMDAWWPYPPPPHIKPGLKTWNLFRSWPQTHLGVFPNWQTHQPVTAGSITDEGQKLEQERRLRRPWLSSGSEWENWQLPLPAPAVFGAGDEEGEHEEGDLVFGLPLSDGNENGNGKQLSKNKREVVRRRSHGPLEEIPHGSQEEEEEEEHKPNMVDRWGTGWEDGDGKIEDASPTSNNHTQAEEVEENSAEEHHHHLEEIKEDTGAGENAKGHEGHEGHDHHGPMCDWSFWEPVIGVLVVLVGLWWFLVRRGRAGLGGLSPGFTVHKPAWMSSLGRGFRKEKGGVDVEEGQAMLTA